MLPGAAAGKLVGMGDFTRLLDAWPTLPQAVRAGILALVRAAAAEL